MSESDQHGQDQNPYRPGGDSEGALESASHVLGIPPRTNRAPSSRERGILQGRQERDLEIWAKERGCWRDSLTQFADFIHGGAEHRVYPCGRLFLKATYAGRYGFTVIATPGGPTLTSALPAEYLHRLLVSNRIFSDDVRLEGVTRDADGVVIVTSQPTIIGIGATEEEMMTYFLSLHFEWIRGYSAGYRGAMTFYRDLDQVAVFDAHPANFLKDGQGIILPIDGVVVECDDALAAQMEALLSTATAD